MTVDGPFLGAFGLAVIRKIRIRLRQRAPRSPAGEHQTIGQFGTDQANGGQTVTYQADANYESIGRRRIAAAYQPAFQLDGTPDGWLAFVEDVTNNELDEPDTLTPAIGPQVQPAV